MKESRGVRQRFDAVRGLVDERCRRLIAASESIVLGRGGIAAVSQATGLSRQAIRDGVRELQEPDLRTDREVRRPGGGRKKAIVADPGLLAGLDRLLEPARPADPESSLRWTCKSLRRLAAELAAGGHTASHRLLGELLPALGYTMQPQGRSRKVPLHADRAAQFAFLNQKAGRYARLGRPVIAVTTGKWRPAPYAVPSTGTSVTRRDLPGAVLPSSWLSLPVDQDTAGFAAESIGRWWEWRGRAGFPGATDLLIVSDLASTTGLHRSRWKMGLQKLADATGLHISVCHLPPGTYRWNSVEHRLLSRMEQDLPQKPPVRHDVAVSLIGSPIPEAARALHTESDLRRHPPRPDARPAEILRLDLRRDEFHGEWNYTIYEQKPPYR